MQNCPSLSELIDFLSRTDSVSNDTQLVEHLDACLTCQALLNSLTTVVDGPNPPSSGGALTQMAPLLRYSSDELSPSVRAALFEPLRSIGQPKRPVVLSTVGESDALPAQVGKYAVAKRLGKGGMGQVLLVTDDDTQQQFALKLISPDLMTRPDVMHRARKEFRVLTHLSHKHIVKAIDTGEHNGLPFLVTEYLQGEDLESRVRQRGPLSVGDACRLLADAAEGLAHAHEHRVIHRDIKPSNLFLTTGGLLKVLDFGTAQFHISSNASSESTVSGYLIGTANYMAPEQLADASDADHRADIYSLGCVLAFLITREPPFGNVPFHRALASHQQSTPPSLTQRVPNIPHELDAIYLRMLSKDRAVRPQSMTETAQLLGQFANRHKSSATGPE